MRAAVLVYLALFLSLGTSGAELLHSSSSHHGHRYCPEHQRLEEIESHSNDEGASPAGGNPALTCGEEATLPPHAVCDFVSGLGARGPSLSAQNHHAAVIGGPISAFSTEAPRIEIRSIALIRVAPKTSPPRSAA